VRHAVCPGSSGSARFRSARMLANCGALHAHVGAMPGMEWAEALTSAQFMPLPATPLITD
jgi:hypothetical protein